MSHSVVASVITAAHLFRYFPSKFDKQIRLFLCAGENFFLLPLISVSHKLSFLHFFFHLVGSCFVFLFGERIIDSISLSNTRGAGYINMVSWKTKIPVYGLYIGC